jgi:RHS repeat-associated protein
VETWLDGISSLPTTYLDGLGLDELFNSSGNSVNDSFLRDGLNSTIALTNASGSVIDQTTYDPYGATSNSAPSQASPFEFTGRENDGNGLYYLRGRYYVPGIARFISRDPTGLGGGTNLYEYAGDDPINASDPTGLDCGSRLRRWLVTRAQLAKPQSDWRGWWRRRRGTRILQVDPARGSCEHRRL